MASQEPDPAAENPAISPEVRPPSPDRVREVASMRRPAGSNASSMSGDPWARQDPWSREPRAGRPLPLSNGAEYEQFLQWRAQFGGGTFGGYDGGFHSQGPLGEALREQHERTTAGPPPEWDGVKCEFKDYKIRVRLWLRTTKTPPVARGPLLLKGLTGGPWENTKHLANDDSWLNDPRNGETLIQLMDTKEMYGEEERESMLVPPQEIQAGECTGLSDQMGQR